MYSCENGYCLTSSIEHKRTSKTLPQTASTSSLPVTKKMRVLNTGKEISEKCMGTFQLMPGQALSYSLPNNTKFIMTVEIWESL